MDLPLYYYFVFYRIYAPGEAVGYTFSKLPDVHNFPSAELDNAVMQTAVAFLPRQSRFSVILCRSQSPSLQSHIRSRKCGSEEICYKNPCPAIDRSLEPTPSTSKCDECSENNKMVAKFEKNRKSAKDYGKHIQEKILDKPPIGRKLTDAKNECSINIKSQMTSCPLNNSLKRKVDQLSPTIKHAHEFPSVVAGNEESDSSFVQCHQNSQVSTLPSELPVIASTSTARQTEHMVDGHDFKSPDKCVRPKGLQKPSTLTVSTNNTFMGSKRLPSPKVIVTGSKKPEPSIYKKRCLDLNSASAAQEEIDPFVAMKPLSDITSGDLHDLIKPLCPSDLEAYLSSLSSKAPLRLGASKLDEIPTTKCSFFLGDEESIRLGENSQGESKVSEIDPKKSYCAKPKSLSLVENICDSSLLKKPKESCVRNLFSESDGEQKSEFKASAFLSEIDAGILEEPSNVSLNGDIGNSQCDQNIIPKSAIPKSVKSHTSDTSDHSDLHQKSLSREVSPKREETHVKFVKDVKLREETVHNSSIPNGVSSKAPDVLHLVEDLECMDIDDSSKFPTHSSTLLDKEVEQHFERPSDPSQDECTETVKGASKSLEEPCDSTSSPSRELPLCKSLLQKEFQQNVKNVSIVIGTVISYNRKKTRLYFKAILFTTWPSIEHVIPRSKYNT